MVRLTGSAQRGIASPARSPPSTLTGAAVLLHTGWDRHWGTAAYGDPAPFLTEPAAQLLADAGARLVGIDSVNIDDAHSGGQRPAHSILLGAGIPVLEHLTGLADLPATGPGCTPRRRGCATSARSRCAPTPSSTNDRRRHRLGRRGLPAARLEVLTELSYVSNV